MNALVIYDSKFGNTRQLAEAIGASLEERYTVRVLSVIEAAPLPADIDLLVVGGPTQAHGASAPMKGFLDWVGHHTLPGVPAAAFDTRFKMPRWLSGSAAGVIGGRLRKEGCALIAPPESFFVTRSEPVTLLPGEIERAAAWARALPVVEPAATPAARR